MTLKWLASAQTKQQQTNSKQYDWFNKHRRTHTAFGLAMLMDGEILFSSYARHSLSRMTV